jgi:flagellar M-ring protein FliF
VSQHPHRRLPCGRPPAAGLLRLALALAAVFLVALGARSGIPNWCVVYESENPGQVAGALVILHQRDIDHRISDDGRSLAVPDSYVGEARIYLANSGFLTGLRIIDFPQSSSPSSGQDDWMYQRALQGELTRSIMQLEAVRACRVELTLENPGLPPEDQRGGSADIFVSLRAGEHLSTRLEQAIVTRVASTVEDAVPWDVSITDITGARPLHEPR